CRPRKWKRFTRNSVLSNDRRKTWDMEWSNSSTGCQSMTTIMMLKRRRKFNMTKKPIILDTDPGTDDAVALAVALHSEELEGKLITTVAGNVGLDKVTRNALKLLTFFNKNIPVAKGAAEPLIREGADASNVHGESGMEGYDFGEPNTDLLLDE